MSIVLVYVPKIKITSYWEISVSCSKRLLNHLALCVSEEGYSKETTRCHFCLDYFYYVFQGIELDGVAMNKNIDINIKCVRLVPGITFLRYPQSQMI
jgi:hypothetical protein